MRIKVSSKYQLVIPKDVRNALGINVGSELEVVVKGGVACLIPVPDLKGLQKDLAGKINPKNLR